VFDLAIVDLRMPPDRWGGLWLLDQIKRHGLGVDTIVLSGEAGQRETIEAMRLGAADFVVKDSAQDELPACIEETLARAAEARTTFARTRLPAPIAIPYQRIRTAQESDSRLQAGLRTVEATLRFCALAAIAQLRSAHAGVPDVLDKLRRPSLGTWVAVCRAMAGPIEPHPLHRWLHAATKEVDVVVRYRNDAAHGGGVPPDGIDAAIAEVDHWIDAFLLAARSGAPVELIVAGPMTFTGHGFTVDIASLAGAALAVSTEQAEVSSPLVSGHVYIRTKTGSFTDMWPLVTAGSAGAAGDWTVAVLDGFVQQGRGEPSPTDRLRYVDVTTGTRRTSADSVFGDLGLEEI
jgi:CheY-like chemotaxis protein